MSPASSPRRDATPTDRLTPVPGLPRTLQLPRVRRAILRDPIDTAAADLLDAYLRGDAHPRAAVALVDAITAGRHLSQIAAARLDQAVAAAITAHLNRLRPATTRAETLLAAAAARCPRCTATDLCAEHQHVLHKWFDLRDQAAVAVVNTAVAALAVPRPASARRRGARS